MPSAPVRHFLHRLDGVKADGSGWMARCPAHEDQRSSLHVAEGDDGRVLLTCHAKCSLESIVHKAGAKMSDLFPHDGNADAPGRRGRSDGRPDFDKTKITGRYDYVDENSVLLYQVLRDAHKNFRQRRPTHAEPPAEIFAYNLDGVRKLLYRLPEIVAAIGLQKEGKFPQPIFICEGEKDVDALQALGLIATTNSGGAGKWSEEHTDQLAGATSVVIIPDNDEPGRRHSRVVGAALSRKVGKVGVLTLPGLPEKGDVSDWLSTDPDTNTKDRLLELAARAEGFVPEEKRFTSIALGAATFVARRYERPRSLLGDGLLSAGDLAFLYGRPGLGKTWAALMLGIALVRGEPWLGLTTPREGLRVGVLELELHATRLQDRLRVIGGDGGLTPRDDALEIVARPDLRGAVDVLDDTQWSAWGEWCRGQRLGLLIVDSLSRSHHVDENQSKDFAPVLARFDELRHETGTAILAIHHEPKTPGGGKGREDDMDALRGTSRMASDANLLVRLARVGHGGGPLALRFPKVNNTATPAPVYLEHDERGLLFVTEAPAAKGEKNLSKVLAALQAASTSGGLTAAELQSRTGLGKTAVSKPLAAIGAAIVRSGRETPRYLMPPEQREEGAA